jgi:hypothetical protein
MNQLSSSASMLHARQIGNAIKSTEVRLEALCDLIDQELRNGTVGDEELDRYAKAIAGDVDRAMCEEESWIEASDFIQ